MVKKNLPGIQETRVQSLIWGDPLKKRMVTQSSILAGRILWTESLVDPWSPWGHKEVDMT